MDETELQSSPDITSSVPESTPAASTPDAAPEPVSAPVAPAGNEGFTSIRDHVSGLGYRDLASQYQDDESFVNFLVQQHQAAQQSQQMAPYAQRYLANAGAFEQFLAQQAQTQQQTQTAPKKSFWSPPEYNPA